MNYLFFDTETTGIPRNYNAPVTNTDNWPRLVQLAWILTDENGLVQKQSVHIICPVGFVIPEEASSVHGITTEQALKSGEELKSVLHSFCADLESAERVIGHNIDFDIHIVGCELHRMGMDYRLLTSKPAKCTMKSTTDFCAIRGYYGYKYPRLEELYRKLFGCTFSGAHDALTDIQATKECFFELQRRHII